METNHTKCLIIGSGPAGYTAAIYAARANLKPILYHGLQPGGQLTTTTDIENFPGFPNGITGQQLMDNMSEQAKNVGADIRSGVVTSVDFNQRPFEIIIDNHEIVTADTVIIATGATAKYLGLDDEKKYAGLGVSACATCDGFFYRGRTVAVVGGGDTACEEAVYLSGLAKQVYLIVRRNVLRASKAMQQKVAARDNIKILYNTNTEGLFGEEVVEGARLVEYLGTPEERHYELPIDGFFLAIGHHPNTDVFKPFINIDEQGYIMLPTSSTATNVSGVFAAGDVADPHYRQAISAAGMGCRAAMDAERYIVDNNIH